MFKLKIYIQCLFLLSYRTHNNSNKNHNLEIINEMKYYLQILEGLFLSLIYVNKFATTGTELRQKNISNCEHENIFYDAHITNLEKYTHNSHL